MYLCNAEKEILKNGHLIVFLCVVTLPVHCASLCYLSKNYLDNLKNYKAI